MAGMSHAVLVVEATLHSGTLITSRLAVEYNRDVLTVPGSIFSESTEGPHLLLKLGATPVKSASDVLEALHINEYEKSAQAVVTKKEQNILNALHEPLEMSVSEINTLLLGMELKGLVQERLGKIHKQI